jgi:hypothetical protein
MVETLYEACIRACRTCAMDCEVCLKEMLGKESHNACPACCYECIALCDLCAQVLVHNSPYALEYCRLCASVCDWCAEQCGAHKHAHCKQCAESCRQCARACRAILA